MLLTPILWPPTAVGTDQGVAGGHARLAGPANLAGQSSKVLICPLGVGDVLKNSGGGTRNQDRYLKSLSVTLSELVEQI